MGVQLLTSEQVGELLGGKHPKTVLLLFRRGELPGIKLGARSVRFDPADVARYIDRHRVEIRDGAVEQPEREPEVAEAGGAG